MAYEHVTLTLPGLRANSTGLATSQFKIGKLASTAGQVVLNATSAFAGNVVGVIMNAPGPYEEVEFAVAGVAKVLCASTTIAIGDWIGCNTTSQGPDAGTTDNGAVLGRALQVSGTANNIASVLLSAPGGGRY